MSKRNWTVEEKFAIVMEGLKDQRSVADICREHQISQNLYYRWRDKFLDAAKQGLVNGGGGNDQAYRQMIEKLQKIIGKQAIQIEILKKTDEWLETKSGR
jgi:transposase-like protein